MNFWRCRRTIHFFTQEFHLGKNMPTTKLNSKQREILTSFLIISKTNFLIFSDPQCSYIFDITLYSWHYKETKCGRLLGKLEFYFHITLFTIIVLFDIVTYRKLLQIKQVIWVLQKVIQKIKGYLAYEHCFYMTQHIATLPYRLLSYFFRYF